MKIEHSAQTAPLRNLNSIPCSFEGGHKGTEVISSACLKPSWAKDGKTFICRHNYQKKESLCSEMQNRLVQGQRREKGALKPQTEERSPKTPTQTFLSQTLWQHGSVSAQRNGDRWEKHNPLNSWKNIKVNYREVRQWTSTSYRWQHTHLHKETTP